MTKAMERKSERKPIKSMFDARIERSELGPWPITNDVLGHYPEHAAPWADVICFVACAGHASAYEIMREWSLTYTQAVYVIDRLEMEGICETLTEYWLRTRAAGREHDPPGPRMLKG